MSSVNGSADERKQQFVNNSATPPRVNALRAWREDLRMSQTDLAHYMGVRERTVRRWEAGRPGAGREALFLALTRYEQDILARLKQGYGRLKLPEERAAFLSARSGDMSALPGHEVSAQSGDMSAKSGDMSAKSGHGLTHAPELVTPVSPSSPVVNSSSLPGKGGAGGKPTREPLTDEQRSKLHTAYDKTLSHAEVEQIIEEALDHQAVKKRKSEYLYLRTWLRTETARIATERARLEKAKGSYAQAVNAEPEPKKFFTSEEMAARHEKALEESKRMFAGLPHPFEQWKSA